MHQALRDLESAARAFRAATELWPEYTKAHANLANVYRELGRFAESEASCRRVLELNPDRADAYYTLGNLARLKDDAQAALAAYSEAGKRQTPWIELLVNWGDTLRETGHRVEAVAMLEQAVAMDSNSPLALNNLGLALSDCGDFERAIPVLEQAATFGPEPCRTVQQFGQYPLPASPLRRSGRSLPARRRHQSDVCSRLQ